MLPLTEVWYRKQLLAAVLLGVYGGLFALAFSIVTTWAIDGQFGDAASDPWSGEWWWIALTAGGAVLVTAIRKALRVPDEVPGAIAMAKAARVDPKLAPKLVIISVVSLIAGASLGLYGLLYHVLLVGVMSGKVATTEIGPYAESLGGLLLVPVISMAVYFKMKMK